ncbi:PH domain-containing protein (plasmid) [Pseudarthrobacter sp. P1]|uniref:PH domain-containing protein n=1 Tax=Pseudarthrobacter sp. P1 TaxID=3418418 RepID=UPI003CEE76CB
MIWAIAAALTAWLAVSGNWSAEATVVPWLALAAWLVYATQWRPCLVVHESGFDVVNLLRTHRIPFAAITDVEIRHTVAIRAGARRYVSWGAPPRPAPSAPAWNRYVTGKTRPYGMFPSNERMTQTGPTSTGRDAVVGTWEKSRHAGASTTVATVTTTWNYVALILGILSLAWCVVSIAP